MLFYGLLVFLAIRLFFWSRIRWKRLLWALTFFSYGVALHDFAHQVYQLKSTVYSVEGGYVGFLILFISLITLLLLGDGDGGKKTSVRT